MRQEVYSKSEQLHNEMQLWKASAVYFHCLGRGLGLGLGPGLALTVLVPSLSQGLSVYQV